MWRFCLAHSLKTCNVNSVKLKISRQQNKNWRSTMKSQLVKLYMDLILINVTKTPIRSRRLLNLLVRLWTRSKSLILLRNRTRLPLKSTNDQWIFGFKKRSVLKISNFLFTRMISMLTSKVKKTRLPNLRNVSMSERMRINPVLRRDIKSFKLRRIKRIRSWNLKRLSSTWSRTRWRTHCLFLTWDKRLCPTSTPTFNTSPNSTSATSKVKML